MPEREHYNTKQKKILLEKIKSLNYDFMIKDLYKELNEQVGLTTIYRFIDKLVEENQLRKYIGKDNNAYYQYLEECEKENHFYLKCDICNKRIHIDCDCITDLISHIGKKHQFLPNNKNIVIEGICKKCRKKGENKLC